MSDELDKDEFHCLEEWSCEHHIKLKAENEKLKKIIAQCPNENDDLGAEYTHVCILKKENEVLRHAVEHTRDFCLCTRENEGFDYGETHPAQGKAKIGARWLTPWDVCTEALKKVGLKK